MNDTCTPEQKDFIRTQALQNRRCLHATFEKTDKSYSKFLDNFQALLKSENISTENFFSGYIPIKHEANPLPIMEFLHNKGSHICLPVVVQKASPLIFREYIPNKTELVKGNYGTLNPTDSVKEIIPSVLIVPMLAFDRKGYRLGFGGGFYDRTIAKLKQTNNNIICIGLAFDGQQIDNIPQDEFDQKLNWIITEKEIIKAK